MNIITLDFETYFDDEYSLSKMTTEAYVRDSRFEVLGIGVRWNEVMDPIWIDGPEVGKALKAFDWAKESVLCHHAHFDGLILSHHFGIKPAFWFDTLSMARLVHGNNISVSLQSLAERHGLGGKNVPYNLFKGKRWSDLDVHARQALADGCKHDCNLTWNLFRKLIKNFPREELDVINLTIRMFTEPALQGDVKLFQELAQSEFDRKEAILAGLGVTRKDVQSAGKFQKLLEAEGAEIETKEGSNGPIPAFAKTDRFMQELLESDNERIAALADARISVRSTINETRAGRLGDMSRRGSIPVYLGYCAAHTTRWGGGDKVNFQNLGRKGDLRKGILAPSGYQLAIVDLSQIECRLLEWFAGEPMDDWRSGADPYIAIASEFYGRPITKADKAERGMGKQIRLSCGYGSGGETIVKTAARGTYGPPVALTQEQGVRARDLYRAAKPKVPALWKTCDHVLRRFASYRDLSQGPTSWRCLTIQGDRLIAPNGLWMSYDVRWDTKTQSMLRYTRDGWVRIWGGVMTQNIMELLGRIVLSQAALRVQRLGIKIALLAHDELVAVVPDVSAQESLNLIVEEMRKTPDWAEGLPLDAEGVLSTRYEK